CVASRAGDGIPPACDLHAAGGGRRKSPGSGLAADWGGGRRVVASRESAPRRPTPDADQTAVGARMTTDMDSTEAWTRRDADLIRAAASPARHAPEHMGAAHMAPRLDALAERIEQRAILDAENGEGGYGE